MFVQSNNIRITNQISFFQNKQNCTLKANPIHKSRWDCTTDNPELDTPYNVIVKYNNSLSTEPMNQSYVVNLLNVTVPPKVELKLIHTEISSASFLFLLDLSAHYDHDRSKNNFLVFNLTLQSNVGFHSQDQYNFSVRNTGDQFSLQLKDLPYPSYNYTVTLRSKMLLSPNDTDMYYSEPASFSFTSKPTFPYRPPRTNMGAFEIIPTNTGRIGRLEVKIFWEALEEFEHNGPDFKYDIKVYKENGLITDMKPTKQTNSSATFEIDNDTDYRFEIFSRNKEGASLKSSHIFVSRHVTNGKSLIEDVWKVTNHKQANLSWFLDERITNFENFTVFWCAPKFRDDYSNCINSVNFEEIPKHERSHVFQHNKAVDHNYGISLNFLNYSTGLVWNTCSAIKDKQLEAVKISEIDKPAQKTEAELRWNVDCQYKSIISGYDFTYCLLDSSDNCVYSKKELLGNKLESNKVRGLKPYSRYRFSIGMIRGNETIIYSNKTIETNQAGEYIEQSLIITF